MADKSVRIDFCAHCGVIIPRDAPDKCETCGGEIYTPSFRIAGYFSPGGALALRNPLMQQEDKK